jgi:hypothetical protein
MGLKNYSEPLVLTYFLNTGMGVVNGLQLFLSLLLEPSVATIKSVGMPDLCEVAVSLLRELDAFINHPDAHEKIMAEFNQQHCKKANRHL